jgi:hypothetical protein
MPQARTERNRWEGGTPATKEVNLDLASSGLMYRLDRAARTWTLLNPRPAFEGLHQWTKAVFASLGYRVLPERCGH